MGINKVGIIVENDYNDILYCDNHFTVNIGDSTKDLRGEIERKLEEILEDKAFRIESISKKIPKLHISNSDDTTETIIMYLVKVYMYSDNSNFIKKEEILNRVESHIYRDYFLKYLIRYNKYNDLVYSIINLIIPIIYTMVILDIKFGFTLPFLFNNLWLEMLVYLVIPMTVLYKAIVPCIVNHLIKYNISEKVFKIERFVSSAICVVCIIVIVFNL